MRPLTREYKKELDQSISYAVKEGYLDDGDASRMTYREKESYLDKSEAQAQWAYDQGREDGN